ncbi:MAG TPA: transcription elongation factor GreA [Planctomycetaceae bacterium]|nr:transcription elongation factor GreA [Planctomycetaceae bacterium]
MERQPITREGYDKKLKEIELLEADLDECTERIKEAREEGDLKENAEYHGQRERQGHIQAKINQLKGVLVNCYIVDKSEMPKGEVTFGSVVTAKNLDDGLDERYEFVGPGEEDYAVDPMKILTSSPIAQSMLGKKVGDVVEVEIPSGTMKMEITEIQAHDA